MVDAATAEVIICRAFHLVILDADDGGDDLLELIDGSLQRENIIKRRVGDTLGRRDGSLQVAHSPGIAASVNQGLCLCDESLDIRLRGQPGQRAGEDFR